MVLLQSKPLERGMQCPNFSLPSVDSKSYSLPDFAESKALLVAFICNHCPYVRAIEDRLIKLKREFNGHDFAMVAICSNDPTSYPDDSKDELLKRWREKNYGFPYLIDLDQNVARAFSAICTPDLFLFDQKRKLFYHGQLDDNWQDETKVVQEHLRDAIILILEDRSPPKTQMPSMGCSIKWR